MQSPPKTGFDGSSKSAKARLDSESTNHEDSRIGLADNGSRLNQPVSRERPAFPVKTSDQILSGLKSRSTTVGCRYVDQLIMTQPRAQLALSDVPLWFCLRTQPKHEHIAAATLRRQLNITCFSPRVRFPKATRRGRVWFIEAMFPGYLFARFSYPVLHRRVEHSPGIRGIVHFGDYLATLDPQTMAALQEKTGEEGIVTLDPEIKVGQSVRIAEGPFQGLEVVVTRLLPARERVKVLLDFLGRPVETEISTPKILPITARA
jgi:transcriptional antiterminator RfaH